jgi:hypothetical protein
MEAAGAYDAVSLESYRFGDEGDGETYAESIGVEDGRYELVEYGATIAGVIDTEELLTALAGLQPLARAAGRSAPDFGDLADVSDIRAAVFVAERTGLIRSAAISLTMGAAGKKAKIDFTYRLKSTNTKIPGL